VLVILAEHPAAIQTRVAAAVAAAMAAQVQQVVPARTTSAERAVTAPAAPEAALLAVSRGHPFPAQAPKAAAAALQVPPRPYRAKLLTVQAVARKACGDLASARQAVVAAVVLHRQRHARPAAMAAMVVHTVAVVVVAQSPVQRPA
jgi:hypothetical protein